MQQRGKSSCNEIDLLQLLLPQIAQSASNGMNWGELLLGKAKHDGYMMASWPIHTWACLGGLWQLPTSPNKHLNQPATNQATNCCWHCPPHTLAKVLGQNLSFSSIKCFTLALLDKQFFPWVAVCGSSKDRITSIHIGNMHQYILYAAQYFAVFIHGTSIPTQDPLKCKGIHKPFIMLFFVHCPLHWQTQANHDPVAIPHFK